MQNRTSSCQSQSVYAHRSSMYRTEINNKPIQLQLYQKNQKCLPLHWMYSKLFFLDVRLFFSLLCPRHSLVALTHKLFILLRVSFYLVYCLICHLFWDLIYAFYFFRYDEKIALILNWMRFLFFCPPIIMNLYTYVALFLHSFCYSLLFGRSKLKESNEEHKFALNKLICKLNTNLTR